MNRISIRGQSPHYNYEILIGRGLLDRAGELLSRFEHRKIFVVTNPVVLGFHGDTLIQGLKFAGFEPEIISIPDGESYKTMETLSGVISRMVELGGSRRSMVATFGGGVTGDLGGFAAACFMRGIDYVHLPTTLLAQVDASVGGKVGVDLPQGKNLSGAFYHPRMVISDVTVLSTLPDVEFSNGMAEVIKTAVLDGSQLLELLESTTDPVNISPCSLERIICLAVSYKARVVEKDPGESGERILLNLGHTIGHAIEAATGYTGISHGRGVALGMVAACRLSEILGILEDESLPARLDEMLARFGLPRQMKLPCHKEILRIMDKDKKKFNGKNRFILPIAPGRMKITCQVKEQHLMEVLKYISPQEE